MRKSSSPKSRLLYLLLLPLILFAGLLIWWKFMLAPVDTKDLSAQIFVVKKGQSIDSIGTDLAEAGLIKSKPAFKIYVLASGISKKIQAGDFRLKKSMDLPTISQELTHGSLDIWVTLLEGWRKEEIANEISNSFAEHGAEFDASEFISLAKSDEGYLFPDTYLFPRDATPELIISQMKNTFEKKVSLSSTKSSLTPKQIVILASLIEREVNTDKDRPIVAGILLNRLENGWPLQIDATIQYAEANIRCQNPSCDWWKQTLTQIDLDRKSPYNTYLNPGLPPAPIANPGLASIEAVLNPQSSDYFFYITDKNGLMHYAKTLEQHNANVSRYLR